MTDLKNDWQTNGISLLHLRLKNVSIYVKRGLKRKIAVRL
jgi:hypothetical protein